MLTIPSHTIVKMKNYNMIIAVFFLISCGVPTYDLKNFTLYKETKFVDSSKLRIDGIYYLIVPKECNYLNDSSTHMRCFVFFENGFLFSANFAANSRDIRKSLSEFIKSYEESTKSQISDEIRFWGAFKIVGDTLLVQKYDRVNGVNCIVFSWNARIISNRTIEFDKSFCSDNVSSSRRFELLQTNDKPDSINLFLTNKRIKSKLDRLYEARHKP